MYQYEKKKIYIYIHIRFRRIIPPNHSMNAEITRCQYSQNPRFFRVFRPGDQIFDEPWPEDDASLFSDFP